MRKDENEIHFIYWKKDNNPDIALPDDIITHAFNYHQDDEVPKVTKIKGFILFRKFTKMILKEGQFDLIIALTSIPCVLMKDILIKQYSNRFIFDYRDYTFEAIGFYKRIITKLVNASLVTFISSDSFRMYLPNNDRIYTTHNILLDSLNFRDVRRRTTRKNDCIRIRYWGFIRHESINKTLISKLANDKRFELHYHGREQETAKNLKRYCNENKISNIFFHGEYSPLERYNFAAETDILHNLFENDTQMSNAVSNKYYDGLIFYIPQICNLGSSMGNKIQENCVGLACNIKDGDFADKLFEYYTTIKWDQFETNCDRELTDIRSEYQTGVDIIRNIAVNA